MAFPLFTCCHWRRRLLLVSLAATVDVLLLIAAVSYGLIRHEKGLQNEIATLVVVVLKWNGERKRTLSSQTSSSFFSSFSFSSS
jgi:hypothetical protein